MLGDAMWFRSETSAPPPQIGTAEMPRLPESTLALARYAEAHGMEARVGENLLELRSQVDPSIQAVVNPDGTVSLTETARTRAIFGGETNAIPMDEFHAAIARDRLAQKQLETEVAANAADAIGKADLEDHLGRSLTGNVIDTGLGFVVESAEPLSGKPSLEFRTVMGRTYQRPVVGGGRWEAATFPDTMRDLPVPSRQQMKELESFAGWMTSMPELAQSDAKPHAVTALEALKHLAMVPREMSESADAALRVYEDGTLATLVGAAPDALTKGKVLTEWASLASGKMLPERFVENAQSMLEAQRPKEPAPEQPSPERAAEPTEPTPEQVERERVEEEATRPMESPMDEGLADMPAQDTASRSADYSTMAWPELRKVAKDRGVIGRKRADIEAASRLVKVDGILAGHDYSTDDAPDVKRVVDEVLGAPFPLGDDCSVWAFWKGAGGTWIPVTP